VSDWVWGGCCCVDVQTGSGKTYTMSGHEEILDRENYQVSVRAAIDVRSMMPARRAGLTPQQPRQGDENTDGVITRSLVYLFEALHRKPDIQYTLKASYLEVYNEQVRPPCQANQHPRPYSYSTPQSTDGVSRERCDADGERRVTTQVYDLLAAPGSPSLPVRHDTQRGFFVPGLAVVPLPSLPHALHMVQV